MTRQNRTDKLAALRRSRLFNQVEAAELEAILSVAIERTVTRGAMIFHKGDLGSSMMAVLSGRVRIGSVSQDGKQVTFAVLAAGDVFGEMALLDGRERSADATALEATSLLEIKRAAFLTLLKNNETLLSATLCLLCDRIRAADVRIETLALVDLPTRLARVMVKLGSDYGRATTGGTRIELRLSQQDLGTLVAASRESVNRQLQIWREAGLLGVDTGLHLIRQPARLAFLAR